MKIKILMMVTIGVLLITSLMSVGINIQAGLHYKTVDVLDRNIQELFYEYKASAFSIDSLAYVQDQGLVLNEERAEKLMIVARENKVSLIKETSENMALILDIEDRLKGFKSVLDLAVSKESIVSSLEDVKIDYEILNNLINQRLDNLDLQVEEVAYQYDILGLSVLNLQEDFKTYSLDLRGFLVTVDYALTALTFVQVLILALIIFRVLYKDLPYILKRFKNLENHEFEAKNLKPLSPKFQEEKAVLQTINALVEDQEASIEFKHQVMDTYLMDEIMNKLYERVNDIVPIERISIAFVDYSKEKIISEYGVLKSGHIKLGPGFQANFKETSLSDIFQTKRGVINNDLMSKYLNKNKSGAMGLIIGEGMKSNMIIPLLSANSVFGFLFFSSNKKDYFKTDHFRMVNKMAYEISGFLNKAYLTKVILSKITASFAELVDRKDHETGAHILRMVRYSVIIAKALSKMDLEGYKVDKEMILSIERNAGTHDIGKVGILDTILKKPGKLDADEWQVMKTHAAIGGDIFKNIRKDMSMFDPECCLLAEHIARYHHEKYNGSGYPAGLKGQDIPLVARIVALADVFDALTSNRVYKKAYTFNASIEIIHRDKGSHFDPYVVDAFDEAIDEIHEIYLSRED